MARDARVDAYIAAAPDFARPILTHLRELAHRAIPGLDEGIKWQRPALISGGRNLASLSAFTAHCAFVIHGDGRQGHQLGDGMGHFGKLTSLHDLPDDEELIARLRGAQARRSQPSPPKPPTAPKPEPAIPVELAEALTAQPTAAATWGQFAPSHRREYLEWIIEAKTAPTRDRRIAQTLEWLAQGKRRNGKYER